MKSPYPYFGGKSKVAEIVWARFGDPHNYVEPFFGSGAVMLARPHAPKIETVNDMDAYLTNFWRALQADPDEVARWCDWPVSELDLHSRHRWLMGQSDFVAKMRSEPDFFDAKIAGWWVWGICQWIGDGWCREGKTQEQKRPVCSADNKGRGIHRESLAGSRPHLGRNQGIHSAFRTDGLHVYLRQLAERTRRVRVCCGDWSRVTGDSVTTFHGTTAVFLDPPYVSCDRDEVYGHDSRTVGHDCAAWAFEAGKNSDMRIALCGYEGEYEIPPDWETVAWKAGGGYGNQAGNENCHRERIWFSPGCLKPGKTLWDLSEE